MDKNVLPNYSSSQITYVEAEVVEFSRFRFHRKRTASTTSTSLIKTCCNSVFSLYFKAFWPKWLDFFQSFKNHFGLWPKNDWTKTQAVVIMNG